VKAVCSTGQNGQSADHRSSTGVIVIIA
jgi:hypothetical protein